MKLTIYGGRRLFGDLTVDGAKNAALPLLAATLLTDDDISLQNIPDVGDVRTMIQILEHLGKRVESAHSRESYLIRTVEPPLSSAPEHLVRRLRASFCLLGPLVARTGLAQISLPGGCPIGVRPVDLHLKGLRALGAQIESLGNLFQAQTHKLHPAEIYLDFPSVGATEQIMMTAALIPGRTVISNAAQDPEVHDLARLLIKMGAGIMIEPGRLIIEGAPRLQGTSHRVIPDRITAGTFLIAGAIAGGDVTVHCQPLHLEALMSKLDELGFEIQEHVESIRIVSEGPGSYNGGRVEARPYPGFATDLQPQMMALLALARGTTTIKETVWENRFSQAAELAQMGAQIRIDGSTATIEGVEYLRGTEVRGSDTRAGAALVLAGLAAQGLTTVLDSEEHIARGYADLPGELNRLGADIIVEEEEKASEEKEVVGGRG
ncbi:UDP-N-acetylglucosamine 1-carboxyvinyltransferase [Candidatus Acetothermia bacterium]|jgi:UDP-N-acetylglucosamine 1-carboxyvinyltransferase|nr:UDP-N-acetylglucosamine 1-carboxyvinyltransferase [Candidatus Acetothermia bacterium]MCI2431264.1 UDP-N-acetylglucosamine 1-carboxyvinyltransferase [Candidatus Acetothermia bacterium]MCI2436279.1 UDP-N-acetylglucosamine 1-carboxyvinyltransferase [Candidatus Acetothermia bacterium]